LFFSVYEGFLEKETPLFLTNKQNKMNIYRTLDKKETKEFQQWAKENYVPGTTISPVWHPVIKEECKKMNTKEYLIDKYKGEFDVEIILDSNPASRNQVESFAQQEVEEQPEKQLF